MLLRSESLQQEVIVGYSAAKCVSLPVVCGEVCVWVTFKIFFHLLPAAAAGKNVTLCLFLCARHMNYVQLPNKEAEEEDSVKKLMKLNRSDHPSLHLCGLEL